MAAPPRSPTPVSEPAVHPLLADTDIITVVIRTQGHANTTVGKMKDVRNALQNFLTECEQAGIPMSGGFQPSKLEVPD